MNDPVEEKIQQIVALDFIKWEDEGRLSKALRELVDIVVSEVKK